MNSIQMISPYKYKGVWVFDDEEKGLLREAFVSGADDLIDLITSSIPNAKKGFNLLFSDEGFPGATELNWIEEEFLGNWYYCEKYKMRGWLCKSLSKYFVIIPNNLYVQVKPIS